MPNPRAQRQLTLDRVVSDLKSFAQPAQAMGDMMAGALRGSVAATAVAGGDIRELIDLFGPEAVEKVLGKRVMPTTEEMNQMLPPTVPTSAPASRQHTAEMYGSMGEFAPTPMSGTAAKALTYGLGRGAGALTKGAGKMVNDARAHNGLNPLTLVFVDMILAEISEEDRATASQFSNKTSSTFIRKYLSK
jgi:hypothetical protein